jgi:membrane protein implicated in regulation of membrane protease activity
MMFFIKAFLKACGFAAGVCAFIALVIGSIMLLNKLFGPNGFLVFLGVMFVGVLTFTFYWEVKFKKGNVE